MQLEVFRRSINTYNITPESCVYLEEAVAVWFPVNVETTEQSKNRNSENGSLTRLSTGSNDSLVLFREVERV